MLNINLIDKFKVTSVLLVKVHISISGAKIFLRVLPLWKERSHRKLELLSEANAKRLFCHLQIAWKLCLYSAKSFSSFSSKL